MNPRPDRAGGLHVRWREGVALAGALAVVLLLVLVRGGVAGPFDTAVLEALHGITTPWVLWTTQALAYIGYGYGTLPVDALIVLGLLAWRRARDALFACAALGGGLLVNTAIKMLAARARPVYAASFNVHPSYSFPSGHAMATAALACTVVALAWPTRWRWPVLVASAVFALAVGASRVQAGVHFPTDVLAGWCAGIAWVAGVHRVVFGPTPVRDRARAAVSGGAS